MRVKFNLTKPNMFPWLKVLHRPPRSELNSLELTVRHGFANNFVNQGLNGAWPSLAPATLRDRSRLGFAPGPILIRTGRYRNSITTKSRGYTKYLRRKSGWTLEIGSRHKHVQPLELGAPSRNLPARPAIGLESRDLKRVDAWFYAFLNRMEKRP